MSKSFAALVAMVLPPAILLSGCSSSSKSATSTIPVAPTPSTVSSYAGSQSYSNLGIVSPGGVWDLTLNTQLKQFSADDISNLPSINSGSAISGVTAAAGSFFNLTPGNGGGQLSNGYALSIPGEAALLRPGYNGEAPVVLAGQTSCLGVQAAAQFLFVTLPNLNWTSSYPAYGSLQANSAATSWTFANVARYRLGGGHTPAFSIPAATCLQAQEGYVVSVKPSTATQEETYTFAIGPTGYFVADLGGGNQNNPGPAGLVGVLEPSSAIATSSLTRAKFLGFYYEPLAGNAGLPVTSPAAFGPIASPAAGTATSITGGIYANDDPTTTPNADTSIDFGVQDQSTNGLFPNATVVVPDPNSVCTGVAVTQTPSGVPGCTLQAAAVVGNANNRFSVFLIAWDTTNATPLGIYLYAQ